MKLLFLLTIMIICLYSLGFVKCENKTEWMSRSFTDSLKGIGIVSVIWAHAGATMGVEGIQFLAAVGVSLFLICSGYGLELSYQKSGLSHFWKKRFLKICIPFWIADCIGLMLIQEWSLKEFLGDALFIHPNWYLQYIAFCYILFWGIKKLREKKNWNPKAEWIGIFFVFFLWFLADSLLFAKADMPFLRARQMFAFPIGIFLAKNKDCIQNVLVKITRMKKVLIYAAVVMSALLFVLLTQKFAAEQTPYLFTNLSSLFTVVPLALAALMLGETLPALFQNRFLCYTGILSYEIFLVQEFSLYLIKKSVMGTILFVVVTYLVAWILHNSIKRRTKHG